ncbi:MAG: helix-turn-helix domain-containing protein [Xanthomonadaceae bacterium]|jgi:DNA-binding transcriptional regulator YiaG|nr:helix-turn-helix domain-containing protein [Xanthomonadaceae bacterium]
MTEFVDNIRFKTEVCCRCGMAFAMPADFQRRRIDDHNWFYCPAGHSQRYIGQSKAQRLQKELEKERELTQLERQRAADAIHELNMTMKAHRRMRKRVMNGVCPCCNRSFENLRRHMQSEHQDFGKPQTLRAIRTAFGMTQADVASEACTKPSYVSAYENGKPIPVEARDLLDWWLDSQQARA